MTKTTITETTMTTKTVTTTINDDNDMTSTRGRDSTTSWRERGATREALT